MKTILPTGIVMKNIEGGNPGDCTGCGTTLPETLDRFLLLAVICRFIFSSLNPNISFLASDVAWKAFP